MELLDERPPELMSVPELVHALDQADVDLARIETRRLRLIAALDATGHAAEVGARDTVQYLEYRYRLDHYRARRAVLLARALPKYPAVSAALALNTDTPTHDPADAPATNPGANPADDPADDPGDPATNPADGPATNPADDPAEGAAVPRVWLRPAQADAIVGELEKVPDTVPVADLECAEQQLVRLAHHLAPADLRKAAEQARNILDTDGPEPEEQKAAARETLTLTNADHGVKFRGYLANENAELLRTLITTGARPHKTIDGEPDPRSREKRRADALSTTLALAATALDAGTPTPTIPRPTTPGTAGSGTASGAGTPGAATPGAAGSGAAWGAGTPGVATPGAAGSGAAWGVGTPGAATPGAAGWGAAWGVGTPGAATPGAAGSGTASGAGTPGAATPSAAGWGTASGAATRGASATGGRGDHVSESDRGGAADAGTGRRSGPGCGVGGDVVPGFGAKANITVTIDLEAATANAIGDTVYGNGLSAATIRRLACDAKVIPIVLGSNSEPLDVGRCERLVTKGIRRALNTRDRGCVVCGAPPIMCDAHHVISWIDGGITAVSNLALLCRRHHVDLHNGHWTITITNGKVHVTRPTWADPPPVRLDAPPSKPPSPPDSAMANHPKADRPMADAALADDPNVDRPKADRPTVDARLAGAVGAEEPMVDAAMADNPNVDGPKADRPTVNDPLAHGVGADAAMADDPSVDGPKADRPMVEDPLAHGVGADAPMVDAVMADDLSVDGPEADFSMVDDPLADDAGTDAPMVSDMLAGPSKVDAREGRAMAGSPKVCEPWAEDAAGGESARADSSAGAHADDGDLCLGGDQGSGPPAGSALCSGRSVVGAEQPADESRRAQFSAPADTSVADLSHPTRAEDRLQSETLSASSHDEAELRNATYRAIWGEDPPPPRQVDPLDRIAGNVPFDPWGEESDVRSATVAADPPR